MGSEMCIRDRFKDVASWDKDKDGIIKADELPARNASLIMSHFDLSGNGMIEKEEVESFLKMFNNGKTLGRSDGTKEKPEPSDETETESNEE